MLATDEGELEFQRYFVARRCAPKVSRISFRGAEAAAPAVGVVEAIMAADAVLIAPSNPYLSIDPILAVAGIAEALRRTSAPVVAVSPLVAGQAVKGPTAKLMRELGAPVSHASIAAHYEGFIDGLLIHDADEAPADIAIARTNTLMLNLEDRIRVARAAWTLASSLR